MEQALLSSGEQSQESRDTRSNASYLLYRHKSGLFARVIILALEVETMFTQRSKATRLHSEYRKPI